jgi:hypothetical protein
LPLSCSTPPQTQSDTGERPPTWPRACGDSREAKSSHACARCRKPSRRRPRTRALPRTFCPAIVEQRSEGLRHSHVHALLLRAGLAALGVLRCGSQHVGRGAG